MSFLEKNKKLIETKKKRHEDTNVYTFKYTNIPKPLEHSSVNKDEQDFPIHFNIDQSQPFDFPCRSTNKQIKFRRALLPGVGPCLTPNDRPPRRLFRLSRHHAAPSPVPWSPG
jgi:hypothetical protein